MVTRLAILIGSLVLSTSTAVFAGGFESDKRAGTGKAAGGGIAFCCSERLRSATGFRGSDCTVIETSPRAINACLEGGFPDGPGDISAGCLSGIWSCEPFVSNGNIVKNCCCEPLIGQGTGTCLNDIP